MELRVRNPGHRHPSRTVRGSAQQRGRKLPGEGTRGSCDAPCVASGHARLLLTGARVPSEQGQHIACLRHGCVGMLSVPPAERSAGTPEATSLSGSGKKWHNEAPFYRGGLPLYLGPHAHRNPMYSLRSSGAVPLCPRPLQRRARRRRSRRSTRRQRSSCRRGARNRRARKTPLIVPWSRVGSNVFIRLRRGESAGGGTGAGPSFASSGPGSAATLSSRRPPSLVFSVVLQFLLIL